MCIRDRDIRCHHQENGGMHAAHNAAYELMDTELNVCLDSDDLMPEDAVASKMCIRDRTDAP